MPADMSRYPANWREIRATILERAAHTCERCGVKNYAVGARDRHGVWHDENSIEHMNSTDGMFLFGDFPAMIKIVLTIAHVNDPDPMNCEPSNLQALCQKCHNQLDAPMRAKNAAETRRRKRDEATGQERML